VPALLVGHTVTPILHRSQIAALLDLPLAAEPDAITLAWDCAAVLDAWTKALHGLTAGDLTAPTPSRGRSLRNLTVNVFHPFELLPAAWERGSFPWRPEDDPDREAPLTTAELVVAYAERGCVDWRAFLRASGAALHDTWVVSSPRGEIAFRDLLAHQRWHAAFHYRQLLAHRTLIESPVADPFPLDRLDALDLPEAVF
jgi:hypothetical protein